MEVIKTMKPWESKSEANGVKEHIEQKLPVIKRHEVHTAVSEKRISLSIELKILAYTLIFSLLVKSVEIIKSLI